MRSRWTTLTSGIVAAVLLTAGMAWYLAYTQQVADDRLRQDFAQRAALTAKLTSGALLSGTASNQAYAQQQYSGPPSAVQAAVDAEHVTLGAAQVAVLAGDGQVLGTYPHSLRDNPSRLLADPAVIAGLAGHEGFSDIVTVLGKHYVLVVVPFGTKQGERVWVSAAPAEQLSMFARAYLSSGVGVGRAFVVDGHGVLLSSAGSESVGRPLADRALAAALSAAPSGFVGTDYYVSAAVPMSSWRVVFASPDQELLAPIQTTRRAAWWLFAAFAMTMLGLLGLGATALSRSARLAYERLHDGLTGLPNRALFIDRLKHELARLRRQRGHVATLFIDLDRFKPINDVHGHGVGDALLTAVARRLGESVRTGDMVSRFGGDEFMVLCAGLKDDQQALEVADRIRVALAVPFEIAGRTLSIGCSIGVAQRTATMSDVDAVALIHNADLAMYRAKQDGRDRIASFEAAPLVATDPATSVATG